MRSDDIKRERKMKEKNRGSKKKTWKKTQSFLKEVFAEDFGVHQMTKSQAQN
jgi:predicted GIY-YIG superfamily endonuclease